MTRFLSSVGTALLVSGCTFFLPHYDPIAGTRVEEITIRSHGVFDGAKAGKLTLSESDRFLNESIGIVSGLRAREESDGNDQPRLISLAALNEHLEILLKRNKRLHPSDAAALGSRLADVQRHYGTISHGLGSDRATTLSADSSDTTTTDTNSSQDEKDKEKCKRDQDSKKDGRCDDKHRR
jgi:hypothetical protein